jgi:hypothetical protein
MEELTIPEIESPKTSMIGFKCNEEDKQNIIDFCEENNYRVSAFCRVAVLTYINKNLKKKKKGKK